MLADIQIVLVLIFGGHGFGFKGVMSPQEMSPSLFISPSLSLYLSISLNTHTHTHTDICVYIYIYIYMYVFIWNPEFLDCRLF